MGSDYVIDYGLKLTKREHYAGLILSGLVTSHDYNDYKVAAADAVGYADALLAALESKALAEPSEPDLTTPKGYNCNGCGRFFNQSGDNEYETRCEDCR